MKKIIIEKPGTYDQLKLKEFPDPIPKKGEVLIKVKAIGVNFADCIIRMGLYSSAKEFVGWPITPGFEISGVVESIGEGVTKFKPGQKVIAITLFGGYTSYISLPEDQIFPLGDKFTFEQGASLPAVFLTAYYALMELAHPRQNDKILVHSAAGGVGSALVQLGKLAGCKVVGVVGASHKVDYVKSLGADYVIDKSTQNLWEEAEKYSPKGYEVILDANGAETLKESYRHLASGGKLIVYGFHTMFTKGKGKADWLKLIWDFFKTPRFNPLLLTKDNKSVMAFNLSYMFGKKEIFREIMQNLMTSFQQEKLVPPAIKTYPLEKAAKAQQDLESGQTQGKLILLTTS